MGDKWQIIISLLITLASTITAVFGWLKARKFSGESNALSSVVMLSQVYDDLPKYIEEAETLFGGGFGLAKMTYVLTKVQSQCLAYSLPYNEDIIKTKVENILATPQSKKENGRTDATNTNGTSDTTIGGTTTTSN